jgi:hypothetical protein
VVVEPKAKKVLQEPRVGGGGWHGGGQGGRRVKELLGISDVGSLTGGMYLGAITT